jgi:hypothetical protein
MEIHSDYNGGDTAHMRLYCEIPKSGYLNLMMKRLESALMQVPEPLRSGVYVSWISDRCQLEWDRPATDEERSTWQVEHEERLARLHERETATELSLLARLSAKYPNQARQLLV